MQRCQIITGNSWIAISIDQSLKDLRQLVHSWKINFTKKIFIWIKKRTLIFISYLLSRCYVSRMIPLVMRFRRRGRSLLCAKSFSHNLRFSKPEVSTGSSALPAAPTSAVENRRFSSTLSFSLPLSSTRRHLGSPRRSVSLSFLPDLNARISRALWLVEKEERFGNSNLRLHAFHKDGNLMRLMRKIFFQAWRRKFEIQLGRDFCAKK